MNLHVGICSLGGGGSSTFHEACEGCEGERLEEVEASKFRVSRGTPTWRYMGTQRAQDPSIKEYSLDSEGILSMI